jgi:hypothetical protein
MDKAHRGHVSIHLDRLIESALLRRSYPAICYICFPSFRYGTVGAMDEGGLAVAWQYRPDGLCRQLRDFKGDLGTIDLSVP